MIIIRIILISEIVGLSNNFIRVQSLSINLGLSVLYELSICLNFRIIKHTLQVMTSKSITIYQARLRRNLIKLDFIPTIFTHKALKHFNTLTKSRKSLTILLMVHMKSFSGLIGKSTRLRARSILTLKPLSQQRRSLTLDIQHKLLAH